MTAPIETSTIYALSSGRGRAGVAVIRLSGPKARAALEALAGPAPDVRRATVRKLIDPESGEQLDEALVLRFEAPLSFTGEDVVELHIHGGPAVLEALLGVLGRISGLRGAEPGEFARRAFENNRLDLTQAEGLADLIEAETQAQRRQALRQSGGRLRALCDDWREKIIHGLSLVEAALDFSDEADVSELVGSQARGVIEELHSSLVNHVESADRGERLRDGLQVVLAGAPNAGKSSLLNSLAERDVAIVSSEPGTTRDMIEVHLDLGGYPVTLVDTAGLREARGQVELEGMRRTRSRASTADIVLWLVDGCEPQWKPPEGLIDGSATLITILNKIDLRRPDTDLPENVMTISATKNQGLGKLIDELAKQAAASMEAGEPAVVTRARQRIELETCRDALHSFLEGDINELELRAEDLRVAAHALGRLSGRVDVEDVLDRIFGDFCIGK